MQDVEEAIRRVLDPHLDKRFTVKRQGQVVSEMMVLMGLRRQMKRPKRTCIVATPDGEGNVKAKKVRPLPHGAVPKSPKVEGVMIAKPTPDVKPTIIW